MDGMDGLYKPMSLTDRRASIANYDESGSSSPTRPLTLDTSTNTTSRMPSRIDKLAQTRPRGPPTPNLMTPSAELDSPTRSNHDPPRPPTPAASPGPECVRPDWSDAGDQEDIFLKQIRSYFKHRSHAERTRILGDLLNLCSVQQLSFVSQYVNPLLKKDPFTTLPDELCLRILSFIDDGKTLARASQVSRRWRDLLSDDMTWKRLCEKHDYRRRYSIREPDMITPPVSMQTVRPTPFSIPRSQPQSQQQPQPQQTPHHLANAQQYDQGTMLPFTSHPSHPSANASFSPTIRRPLPSDRHSMPPSSSAAHSDSHHHPGGYGHPRSPIRSHKSYFKQRYQIESAWRHGGTSVTRHITPDQGVVTSLHLTPKYIIVALDNARIHVFEPTIDPDGNTSFTQKTLTGHVMGVWAMVPWGDTLVSGGCDRDVRVWDLRTGEGRMVLRGHTSTVRCLKMRDSRTAISGSRDTTLRVWDIESGLCRAVLVGHLASVRCLEISGDLVVSGSYDTTAKVWSISEGRCLRTLSGHFSQIYAIAFDGRRVATGSLDTSVRIWDAESGSCIAILQGHTSLVGQLQMRGETLVTGGSDGSVRVWSLEKMAPIHRLAAHDNSVTSLMFDDARVVSGGSDGRVKVWDLKTGQLVRELGGVADAVWRVGVEEERCVVLASRGGRTVMEVWSFSPPAEPDYYYPQSSPMHLRSNSSTAHSGSTPTAISSSMALSSSLPPRPLSETSFHPRYPAGSGSAVDEPMMGMGMGLLQRDAVEDGITGNAGAAVMNHQSAVDDNMEIDHDGPSNGGQEPSASGGAGDGVGVGIGIGIGTDMTGIEAGDQGMGMGGAHGSHRAHGSHGSPATFYHDD